MTDKENESKTKKNIYIIILLLLILSIGVFSVYKVYHKEPGKIIETEENPIETENKEQTQDTLEEAIDGIEVQAINSITEEEESIRLSEAPRNYNGAIIAERSLEPRYTIDDTAGASRKTTFTGRRINVAITGIDGRLGTRSRHADANHVLSILPETGEIEITSIPRDTYCDLGYSDSTGLNKLTICRSNKGRTRYLQEVARIARLDRIHYYVEFGFSQAMGIIEFLGYKNTSGTLQVLRSRKGFGDDYQRTYNQGQFIRQAILSHFNKFTGTFGGVFLRGALLFVETNLTFDAASDIIEKLEKRNFPKSNDDVVVRVRPITRIKYKNYDFTDEENIKNLERKIERFNKSRFDRELDNPQPKVDVARRLNNVIERAKQDSAKRPTQVISKMTNYFNQRAWMQVKDTAERRKIRDEFGILLYDAYMKKNQPKKAEEIREIIETEKAMFGVK